MGLALVIGVATKIYVDKKGDFKECSKEEVLEKLKDSINLDFYDITDYEEDKKMVFSIKEDIFMNNISNLLKSETKNLRWKGEDKEILNELLNKINDAKSVKEVEEIVKEDGSYYLHIMTGCPWETISYIGDGDLCIIAKLLTYSFTYKVLFEEHYELFRYLREKIQKVIDNPLKDDVFPMITTG